MLRGRYLISFACLLASACIINDDKPECVCRLKFESISVYIVDFNGKPLTNFTLTIGNERTAEHYDVKQPNHDGGLYTVINDSFKWRLEASGDPIFVYGEQGDTRFIADFTIGTDDCVCHVQKIAGPDTIMVDTN